MHTTKARKKTASRKRGKALLTKEDLTKIRSVLPKDWRSQIAETRTTITLRQITEVFNQRTTNAQDNIVVWSVINETLNKVGADGLANKVGKVVSFYGSLYNSIQKNGTN